MPHSGHRLLALMWLLAVAAVAFHQYGFWREPDFVADVTELLPRQPDEAVEQATRRLLEVAATQWVVLVGAPGWDDSRRAAEAALAVLDPSRSRLRVAAGDGMLPESAISRLGTARGVAVTREAREWLRDATAEQVRQRALGNLFQPLGDGLSSWRDDPLGLRGEWLRERAQSSRLRPREGWLWMEDGGMQWIALPFTEEQTGFSAWDAGTNTALVAAARERVAGTVPGARLLAAGTSLQAEAAAARAGFEVSVIGTGSLIAVILLTLVTFGSLRPIVLVSLSLLVGCAAALAVTDLVFGRVHLLTMVFGASLIGVAEDYGIHYFAARQGVPVDRRWEQLREIAPGLWLALATSGIAYLALGLAPFPGLRQIAVFSCVGLAAAFLTVLCWFPWLDRKPLRTTAFAAGFSRSLAKWPRWRPGARGWWLAAVVAALALPGLLRLHSVDDVRLLQNVPPDLIAEQVEVGRILGMVSPAQVYLVSGEDEETLLRNEERLTVRLATLVREGHFGGYQALSDWVPSRATQQEAGELLDAANREAWAAMSEVTGETLDMQPPPREILTPAQFAAWAGTALPVGAWRDAAGVHHSLVMLQGVGRAALPRLEEAANSLPGAMWIDNTARYSALLAHYRVRLLGLLLVGAAAVLLMLHWRYGRSAWRAYVPTLLGALVVLSFFGWAGMPMQLFVVLSLILLLGMGIDYGIFMLEHPGERSVWLAVAIAGVSTLLSFGLLALSTTPALRAFGLAILVGETSIWLLTPVFRSGSFGK